MATGDKGGRIVLFQSSDKSEDESAWYSLTYLTY
jgi:hypothetical protein